MNKKKLSVVMAGAMLCSSVAPVLAAEVQKSEVSLANKGTLINDLTDLVWNAPRFSKNDVRVDPALQGKSVYTIKIKGGTADTTVTDASAESRTAVQNAIRTAINKAGLAVGDKIELVSLGYVEVTEGDNKLVLSKDAKTTYTDADVRDKNGKIATEIDDLKGALTTEANFSALLKEQGYVEEKGGFVINVDGSDEPIVIKAGDKLLDFTKYYNKASSNAETKFEDTAATLANFGGFVFATPSYKDIATSVVNEYTISVGGTAYELKDLYDGVMLTTDNGQELLSLAKDAYAAYAKKFTSATTGNKAEEVVKVLDLNNSSNDITEQSTGLGLASTADLTADKNGNYKMQIRIADPFGLAAAVGGAHNYRDFVVTGTDKEGMLRVAKWIDQAKANVDLLAGDNRYETAVSIAKEVVGINKASTPTEIVLVNGNSLVDGLAASPLAHALGNTTPILLTEANSLPKATKTYLRELIDNQDNSTITVHIVGGNAVVSDSIRRELKDLGLKVERHGGDNREATSLSVAEAIEDAGGTIDSAFVVGAEGEADAMSIAGYAASEDTPIIVSKKGGLTEDALDAVTDIDVTVLGGEKAVSASDYSAVKSVAEKTRRVYGANRKATNAAVINTFYNNKFINGTVESVIVAKDDVLIDALTSANLSAQKNAPIVLATNKLSTEQLNAVIANGQPAKNVYQVGLGVANSVVKTVVDALGLK